jgi:hypothetical protein
MLRFEEGVEAESASLRVDRPVYPRRIEHSTVGEGAIDARCRVRPVSASRQPQDHVAVVLAGAAHRLELVEHVGRKPDGALALGVDLALEADRDAAYAR